MLNKLVILILWWKGCLAATDVLLYNLVMYVITMANYKKLMAINKFQIPYLAKLSIFWTFVKYITLH